MDETALALERMKSRLTAQLLTIQAILLTLERAKILDPAGMIALKTEVLQQATVLRWKGSNPADGVRTAEAIEELFAFWAG